MHYCAFLYRRLTHDTQNWNCGFEDDYKNISRNQVNKLPHNPHSAQYFRSAYLSPLIFDPFRAFFSLIPRDCALHSSNLIIHPNFLFNTILIVAQFLEFCLIPLNFLRFSVTSLNYSIRFSLIVPNSAVHYSFLGTYDLYGPIRNAFDASKSIMRASGRVLGPLKWQLAVRKVLPFGAQMLRFPGPNPLPLAQVMDLPASKALLTGPYQSEVHR